jgi:hypothetical protein
MKKYLVFMLATCPLIMAACSKSQPTVKYEYQTVHTLKGANERAPLGWTITNVVVKPDGTKDYLLQRPLK